MRQIVKSHGTKKIPNFDQIWAFPDCNSSLNSPMVLKWCTQLEISQKKHPIVLQCNHTSFKVTRRWKTNHLALIWVFPHGNWNSNSRMAMKWHIKLLEAWKRFPIVFSMSKFKVSRTEKNRRFWSYLGKIVDRLQLSNPSDLPCYFRHYLIRARTDGCISRGFFGFGLFS